MKRYINDRREDGFTLIELLIAIVVVGILTAVAIVGIAGLTNSGSNGACKASKDAAKAASAVVFANTGSYPTDYAAMGNAFDTSGVTLTNNNKTMGGSGWTETIGGGGAAANTFTGSC